MSPKEFIKSHLRGLPNATLVAMIELSFVFQISGKSEFEILAFINKIVLQKTSECHHLQIIQIYHC